MKTILTFFISIALFLNTSVLLAGSHKSKPDKGSDTVATDTAGGQKNKSSKKPRPEDWDDGEDNNKGNERSQEMRDRSDERKQIQEEYRGTREPGQESAKDQEGQPAKKPWYKFWE